MIGPDGNTYDVPESNVAKATEGGWKLQPSAELVASSKAYDAAMKPQANAAYDKAFAPTVPKIETQQNAITPEDILEWQRQKQAKEQQQNDEEFNKGITKEAEAVSPAETGIKSFNPFDINNRLRHFATDLDEKGKETGIWNSGLTPEQISDLKKDDTPRQKLIDEKANKLNPIAHRIGQVATIGGEVAGFEALGLGGAGDTMADLAYKVPEAVEEGAAQAAKLTIGQQATRAAAKFGTDGAIWTAPESISKISEGDYAGAAENTAIGIGFGGLLGAGTSLGGSAIKGATKLAGEGLEAGSDALNDFLRAPGEDGLSRIEKYDLAKAGITSVGKTPEETAKLKTVASYLEELGLTGKTSKETGKTLSELISGSESKMESIRDILETAMKKDPELPRINAGSIYDNAFSISQSGTNELNRPLKGMNELKGWTGDVLSKIEKTIGLDPASTNLNDVSKLETYFSKEASKFEPSSPEYKIATSIKEMIGIELKKAIISTTNADPKLEKLVIDYVKSGKIANIAEAIEDMPKGKIEPAQELLNKGIGNLFTTRNAMKMVGLHSGGLPGLALVNVGDHIVSNWWKNAGQEGASTLLRKAAKDPAMIPVLGNLLAKDSLAKLSAHIDEIPKLIRKTGPAAQPATDAIKQFLGTSANGLSKEKQYKKATDLITANAANPGSLVNKLAPTVALMSKSDPKLATAYLNHTLNTASYLYASLPKNPNSPQPFSNKEWQPTTKQKQEFIDKLAIVNHPQSIFNEVKNGRVSSASVDALKNVYPDYYQKLVAKVIEVSLDKKEPKPSYNTRLQLSKLTGIPMDSSLKNIAAIQAAVNTTSTQQEPPSPRGHASSRPKLAGIGKSVQTDTQRRSSSSA